VKLVAAVVAALVAVPLTVPLLAANSPASRPVAGCGQIAAILDTIRTLESGGDYQARAAGSSASGAYQMIDTTWRSWSARAGFGGQYARAYQAPPAAQDAAATAMVQSILDRYSDVSYVPLAWYYPAAIDDPALMDVVPAPEAGNRLTPRQYQAKWLDTYRSKVGAGSTQCSTAPDGEWALPVPRDLVDRNPAALDASHHDYPAWDFPTAIDTPVYAVHAGTVVVATTWSGNCYAQPDFCVTKCGVGLSIEDAGGVHYIYCHATRLAVALGDGVTPGEQIMWSGNTGHSSGPHLHFGIRIDGVDHCPQPLLRAIYEGAKVVAPRSLPTVGCST
jgi:hypothetical protein